MSDATPAREGESDPSRLGLPALLLVAVFIALTAAALELVVLGVQKFALGSILRMSRDVLWMAPLGQLMIYVSVALLLALGAVLTRRRIPIGVAVGVFAFLAAYGLLLIPEGVHPLALAVAALGIGVQSGRLAATRPGRVRAFARRAVPVQLLILALIAGGVQVTRLVGERRAIAALPAPAPRAPNVILLIWDTVRARSLSLYGGARRTTPNLDSLARHGVVFDRAISPSSWTLPSHAAMFTGLPPNRLEVGWSTPLADGPLTLAEAFRDAGYATGGFAANLLYTDWEHGLGRGFVHYEDYTRGLGQILVSTTLGFRVLKGRHGWERAPLPYLAGYRQFIGRRLGESVDEEFLEWIDARGDRPFFAFLNYYDAHLPYEPPPPFDTLFEPERPPLPFAERLQNVIEGRAFWTTVTDEQVAAELAAYEASIAYLDHRLSVLVGELEERHLLDSTLIVITSDHGEEFLEHGDHEHGSNLYETQIGVPLVILFPGQVPAGVRVREAVSTSNVAATIAELSELPAAVADSLPGYSLAALWSDSTGVRDSLARIPAFSELVPGLDSTDRMHSLVLDGMHFIRNPDGRPELYDLVADPGEFEDLSDSTRLKPVVQSWTTLLDAVLQCEADGCCCQASVDLVSSSGSGRPQLEQKTAARSGRSPQAGQATTRPR